MKISMERESIRDRDRDIKENQKKKPIKKEQTSLIKNFLGKEITITLRNGNDLKGKLETVTQYEVLITSEYIPVIVMKHAIDYIKPEID